MSEKRKTKPRAPRDAWASELADLLAQLDHQDEERKSFMSEWKAHRDAVSQRVRHLRDLLRGVQHEQPDLLDGRVTPEMTGDHPERT